MVHHRKSNGQFHSNPLVDINQRKSRKKTKIKFLLKSCFFLLFGGVRESGLAALGFKFSMKTSDIEKNLEKHAGHFWKIPMKPTCMSCLG